MPLVVNTNIASLNAQRNLIYNTTGLNKSLERLSSGYRINKAADDAAGLQISEKLRSQIRGTSQAIGNAEDGINLLAIAEGTLSGVNEHLQRIRELTVQAANDTNGTAQRDAIKQEIDARVLEIQRITRATQFNGIKLLSGNNDPLTGSFKLQIGPNSSAALDTIDIITALGSATASQLAADGGALSPFSVTVESNSAARTFLDQVDDALTAVGTRLAQIGTYQNRLEGAISNMQITRENYEAAESRIRNADVAKEAASMAKYQILQQAATSILSQANQAPALALSLIS